MHNMQDCALDIDPVLFVLDLHMKYTVEVVPLHTYILWFVIVCKKCWSCLCILLTLDDDSECHHAYSKFSFAHVHENN